MAVQYMFPQDSEINGFTRVWFYIVVGDVHLYSLGASRTICRMWFLQKPEMSEIQPQVSQIKATGI